MESGGAAIFTLGLTEWGGRRRRKDVESVEIDSLSMHGDSWWGNLDCSSGGPHGIWMGHVREYFTFHFSACLGDTENL